MAGYIGSKSSVTLVDGYTEAEADAEFVAKAGDTMTGNLDVGGAVSADGLTVSGVSNANLQLSSTGGNAYQFRTDTNDAYIYQANRGKPLAKFAYGGDISFYEDTGTTPKFFWDASAESLGIGTAAPSHKAHISTTDSTPLNVEHSNGTDVYIKLSNTADGAGNYLGADSNNLTFWTENTERMRLESGGALKITSNDIKSSISGTYYLSGANGTAGSPTYVTYSFVDDVNTGMYRGGADTLNFATGGVSRMSISSTGVISGDGSGLTGVGASTAYGAVGTYVIALRLQATANVVHVGGSTFAGSDLKAQSATSGSVYPFIAEYHKDFLATLSLSGTWRLMVGKVGLNNTDSYSAMYVRIS